MFDIKRFGAYLSRLRKNRDMTQMELADILNVTRQCVSKYENGDSFPDISVLLVIADTFNISLDNLINAGNPSNLEKSVLTHIALNKTDEIPNNIFEDSNISKEILNIAPLLKASTLEVIGKRFKHHEIDITNIVRLAEYMNDTTIQDLLEKASYERLDEDLLARFIPLLDQDSKMKIFDKILNKELDPKLIKVLTPYTDDIYSLVENAVVCGVLDHDSLKILRGKDEV